MLHLLQVLVETAALAGLGGLLALAAGLPLWRLATGRFPSAAELTGPCFLLGLVPLTLLALLLGLLQALRGPLPGLAAAAFLCAVLLPLRGVWWSQGATVAATLKTVGREHRLWCALTALLAFLQLGIAAAPNTGWDAFTYHYALAEDFRRSGTLAPQGASIYEYWHLNAELLNALWFGLGGERMANAVALAQALSLTATVAWAARRLGANPGVSVWTGLVVLGLPVVQHQASGGWVDTFLIQGILCAYVLYELGRAEKANGGWALLAGLAAGYAWGVKQSAPMFLFPLALLGLWDLCRGPRTADRTGALLLGAGVLLIGAPWLARTWAYTGNPVFPALRGLTKLRSNPYLTAPPETLPWLLRPLHYLRIHMDRTTLPVDGLPLWVPVLAGVGLAWIGRWRRLPHVPRLWTAALILFLILYIRIPVQARYALPLWTLTLVAAAPVLSGRDALSRRAWTVAGAAAFVLGAGIAGGKAWSRREYLLGRQNADAFRHARYPHLALLDRHRSHVRPEDVLLVFDGLRFRTGIPTYDADPRRPGTALALWNLDPPERVRANLRALKVRWLLFPFREFGPPSRYLERLEPGRADEIRRAFPEWNYDSLLEDPHHPALKARATTVAVWLALRPELVLVEAGPGVALYRYREGQTLGISKRKDSLPQTLPIRSGVRL